MTATSSDPVRSLMSAERDGLLHYHGFVSGGRYEAEIAGRVRILPAAEVADTVERLRAVAGIAAAGVPAKLVDLRDDGTHIVEVGGQLVELAATHVVDWCAGYTAAHVGQGQKHTGDDQLAKIADLFDRPSRDDQCRMVIWGLMYGREDPVSISDLAEMIGQLPGVDKPPAKKTVLDALGFGQYFASDLAEKMIAAFGLRWSVTAGPGACEQAEGGKLAEPLPEMPGLARMRHIVAAARAGWLRYVDEPSPNKVRWNRRYQLAVGDRVYVISAEGLHAWLDGLAAFHTGKR